MDMPVFMPPAPASGALRHALAAVLHSASIALARAALALGAPPARAPAATACTAQFEFHADAGAPEGALYADGRLVALLPGVQRL